MDVKRGRGGKVRLRMGKRHKIVKRPPDLEGEHGTRTVRGQEATQ